MTMIKISEFKSSKDAEKLVVIDVREPWEHEEHNIGAKNIPLCKLPDSLDQLKKYKNQEIIVHCQSGKRSNQAQKYLTKQGFASVKSLEGGLEAYLKE